MNRYSGKCARSQEYPFYYCQSAASTLKRRGAGSQLCRWRRRRRQQPPQRHPDPLEPCYESSLLLAGEAARSVTRVLQGFSSGCLFCLSVRAAAGLWHQSWLPAAPWWVGVAGDSKVNDHLPGYLELLGDAL